LSPRGAGAYGPKAAEGIFRTQQARPSRAKSVQAALDHLGNYHAIGQAALRRRLTDEERSHGKGTSRFGTRHCGVRRRGAASPSAADAALHQRF
jgi:hypothetical protein